MSARRAASTDLLTGLANRRTLYRALGRFVDDTVIMLDLDHFKQVMTSSACGRR